ncbi:MAG: hypothetical protein ACE10D_12705 [Planctomycetota bacterium]
MRTAIHVSFVLLLAAAPVALAESDLDTINNLFKVWDRNEDGTLSRDEAPDPQLFDKIDANQDGKVTREEAAAFLGIELPKEAAGPKETPKAEAKPDAKPGARGAEGKPGAKESKSVAAVKKRPVTVKQRTKDFFERFDLNKDGKIQKSEFRAGEQAFGEADRSKNGELSRKEVSAYIKAQLELAKRNPRPDNFMDLFDRNRDDKVTKREYDGPGQFFRMYDHDRNGVIVQEELNMGPRNAMMRNRPEIDRDGPTRAPKRTLLDRYDADGDRKITLEELGGAENLMRRLDKNGDGVLSAGEAK